MSLTITLAGKPYEVQPLTLGQIEALSIAVVLPDSPDPQETVRRSFQRTIDVVAAGLSVSHPEMTGEALRKLPISKTELMAAYAALLEASGLIAVEKKPGEADPPAPKPGDSTGSPFTDGSAPA